MQIMSLSHKLDVDGDGTLSRWEVLETLKWVYHLPGNLIMEGLGHVPYLSGWLGIEASAATGYGSFGSLPSVVLSLLVWLALFCGLISLRLPARRREPSVSEPPLRLGH